MTPRRRGAHCELTFHSFSRETRSRVVLLLPSYSCTSPAIIYLEIRGSSPSQALIPRSSGVGYHSSFPHIRIYVCTYTFHPLSIFAAHYPRPFLFFLSFPFLSFPLSPPRTFPFRERGCSPSVYYLSRVSRERNGTRVRTCTGLRRVTRASQLGKCEIISAFCHVPLPALFPRYLLSPFLRTCLRTTLARS